MFHEKNTSRNHKLVEGIKQKTTYVQFDFESAI